MTREDIEESIRLMAQYVEKEHRNIAIQIAELKLMIHEGGKSQQPTDEITSQITELRKLIQEKKAVVNKEEIVKIHEELKRAESEFEEEEVARINIEKHMKDIIAAKNSIEQNVIQYENKTESKMVTMRNDIRDLRLHIQGIENRVEANALKLLTSHIESFANTVDRKLTNIITRDEYQQGMVNVDQKIIAIEKPDISHMEQRIIYLEQRLGDIHNILAALSTRIPVVVE